ncbi:MAG: hypothetical protein FJY11_00635 [Bacteroidetes bacterium]|nr:hypothetical protein [Bacteroidota bacterium]
MAAEKTRRIILNADDKAGYSIYGLASPEADYKLSLALNATRRYNLRLDEPVKLGIIPGKGEIIFPRFSDLSLLPHSWATLIVNRSDNQFLVKKPANIDFLFITPEENPGQSIVEMQLTLLRSKGLITGFFRIEADLIDREILDKALPRH